MPYTTEPIDPRNDMDSEFEEPKLEVALKIERGNAKNNVRNIAGPVFTIGSALDCDLVLGDAQFPSYHSYVYLRGNRVSLRYMGFGPELTVNGREFRWGELRDGDRVRTGPYQFAVSIAPIAGEPADDVVQAEKLYTFHDSHPKQDDRSRPRRKSTPVHLHWTKIMGEGDSAPRWQRR